MAVMAEAEIAEFSLSPSERNYVALENSPESILPSEKLLPRREVLFLVTGLSLCLYLLDGQFANHACTLLTSVPAAIFTYKVLSEKNPSQASYRSILFYWVLQGGLELLDVALADSYGYFLAKFILMSFAFGHAASQNKETFYKMVNSEPLPLDSTQCITSIVSLYDTEGYAIQTPASSIYMESTITACPIHSDDEVTMMSTQRDSENRYGINRAQTPHPDAFANDTDFSCLLPQQQESQCTVELGFGDMITTPMERLVFKKPEETLFISVVNISEHNMMWALKCNALHRLAASPACGVIQKGGKEMISVVYREGASLELGAQDKLAIDYAFDEQFQYSSAFVEKPDKKRHLLRVSYEFE